LNERHDFIRDSFERLGIENAFLRHKKTRVRRKELGRAGVAHETKAAVLEIIIRKLDCSSVGI